MQSKIKWMLTPTGSFCPCLGITIGPQIAPGETSILNGWQVDALVDTGADHSFLASSLVAEIRPKFVRRGSIDTTSGRHSADYYAFSIMLDGTKTVIDITASSSIEERFFNPYRFVVGRDILALGRLTLSHQKSGLFSLNQMKTAQ